MAQHAPACDSPAPPASQVGPIFGSICASALYVLLNTDALGSDKELASAAGGVAMGDGGSAVTPKEDLHKEYENEAFVAEVPAPDVPIGGAPDTAVQV